MDDNKIKRSYALELSAKLIERYPFPTGINNISSNIIADGAIAIVDRIFDKYKEDEGI